MTRSADLRSGHEHNHERIAAVWHTLSSESLFNRLHSDPTLGLTRAEAARRLSQDGPNVLVKVNRSSPWELLLAQFSSLIVYLLAAAAVVAFSLGENLEAVAILVVIILNAGIGFLTEWRAGQALAALQKQAVRVAHVVRDGVQGEIPAAELVAGDLVILAAGARVPADGRIVECARLQIEEAALTGESMAVTKSSPPLTDPRAALGDRVNMAFMGTTITDGRGRLLVTATGSQTEVGKIGLLLDESFSRESPLEQKLARLGRTLVVLVASLCSVIVLSGWLRGVTGFAQMLKMGLSLAIAAVPEGLPAVTTMTLALGMQRMARMRAIIRRLPAVETLGSVTVICTDKTGTLTKNEMTVCVYALDGRRIDVSGTGYEPTGSYRTGDSPIVPTPDEQLALALRIGMLCNDARIDRSQGAPTVLGDPTEAALLVAAEKSGIQPAQLACDFPRIDEVPFDSVSRRMITVHRTPAGATLALLKGSPGTLIAGSASQLRGNDVTAMTPDDRIGWEAHNRELASSGLRVLGLAYRQLPDKYDKTELDRELAFVGLVGMRDPLRDEVRDAVEKCRRAGIRTVMITGDQESTATAIARQLGMDLDSAGRPLRTVHGRELANLDSANWQRVVSAAAVFARVSPEHKLRIVEALQAQGHVVAMTGDGVNDAPALRKADIGIAMGVKGTEIAKENSDMVITDDNFATIVGAVEQGRIIYANIVRFLHYLLSCNLSEILTVFFALMIGWPLPLLALQILWLNLVTDVLPAFALALEPSSPDAMSRPPRHPREPLMSRGFIGLIVWQGVLLAAATLIPFAIGLHGQEREGVGDRHATTMAFMTLALTQIIHVFNARSQTRSIFTARLWTNGWLWVAVAMCLSLQLATIHVPLLRRVLQTAVLSPSHWLTVGVCSLLPMVVIEMTKALRRPPLPTASGILTEQGCRSAP